MTLSPQAVRAMELAGDLPTNLSPSQLREQYTRERMKLQPPRPDVWSAREIIIPGRDGPIAARVYTPSPAIEPRPLMLYFHGGGWVVGSLEGYDTSCRRLALTADCVVVSVDYRLAPENRFPAAVRDAWDATTWCVSAASELGIDASRVIVAGDSAGGTLAAVVALQARDEGGPNIALQVLIYPATDLTRESPSYSRNASGYMLTAAALRWFIERYVPDVDQRSDWRASPLLRDDLVGAAPALVISAEYDPLVDENEAYAKRLEAAGVPTQYVCFPGMIHPFFTLGGVVDDAAAAERLIADAIARLTR
ncbi:MAG: alpha/beta hydrolase [Burkholderiales bacterium]|nr:alpha/beta hydrolase [Burkholderiales bacterium]